MAPVPRASSIPLLVRGQSNLRPGVVGTPRERQSFSQEIAARATLLNEQLAQAHLDASSGTKMVVMGSEQRPFQDVVAHAFRMRDMLGCSEQLMDTSLGTYQSIVRHIKRLSDASPEVSFCERVARIFSGCCACTTGCQEAQMFADLRLTPDELKDQLIVWTGWVG